MDREKNGVLDVDFPMHVFDCNNGNEFISHHLIRHFANRKLLASQGLGLLVRSHRTEELDSC
jgi:hypothetical protein